MCSKKILKSYLLYSVISGFHIVSFATLRTEIFPKFFSFQANFGSFQTILSHRSVITIDSFSCTSRWIKAIPKETVLFVTLVGS